MYNRDSSLSIIIYIIFIFSYVCLYVQWYVHMIAGIGGGSRRILNIWNQSFRLLWAANMGPEHPKWVLWTSSMVSYLLSHLSSPYYYFNSISAPWSWDRNILPREVLDDWEIRISSCLYLHTILKILPGLILKGGENTDHIFLQNIAVNIS